MQRAPFSKLILYKNGALQPCNDIIQNIIYIYMGWHNHPINCTRSNSTTIKAIGSKTIGFTLSGHYPHKVQATKYIQILYNQSLRHSINIPTEIFISLRYVSILWHIK